MIAIFRHGETLANEEGRLCGWSDSPLTGKGHEQVRQTAAHFAKKVTKEFQVKDLYFSSLGRSIRSALIFQEHYKMGTLNRCDSLRERCYGRLEGFKNVEFNILPKYISTFLEHYNHTDEALADVYERVSRFLDIQQIRQDCPDRLIVFHVHGNVSKILRGIYLRLHPDHWIKFEHPQNFYYIIEGNHCEEIQC